MRYVCIKIRDNYLRVATVHVGDLIRGSSLHADGTGVGDESIFERVEVGEHQVALRSFLGGYLQAHPDGIVLLNPAIGEWETFTEVWWPDDRISLKSCHGTFICAERGGGGTVVVNRAAAGDWEKFTYEVPPPELLPVEEPVQEPAEEFSPIKQGVEASAAHSALAREVASQHIVNEARKSPFEP